MRRPRHTALHILVGEMLLKANTQVSTAGAVLLDAPGACGVS
jgi:hypothetical protein